MSICPCCHGTGADPAKTAQARKSGICDKYSYIRRWNCHGNGNDPAADFVANLVAQRRRSEAEVAARAK